MDTPTATLRIDVTDGDIRDGIASFGDAPCRKGPISRAAKRAASGRLGPTLEASTGTTMLRFVGARQSAKGKSESVVWEGRLPNEATQFVDTFDRGEPVSPFSFTVTLELTVGALIYDEEGVETVHRCGGPDSDGGCPRAGLRGLAACANRWIVPIAGDAVMDWRIKVPADAEDCPLSESSATAEGLESGS